MKTLHIHAFCLSIINSPSSLDNFLNNKNPSLNNLPSKKQLLDSKEFLEKQGLIATHDSHFVITDKGKQALAFAQVTDANDKEHIENLTKIIKSMTNKSSPMHIMEFELTGAEFLSKRKDAFSDNQEVVYIVSCFKDNKSSEKRSIGRVLGKDESGILYIGRASTVNRLLSLLRSIRDGNNGKNHSFGIRYKDNQNFRAKFPLELLSIRLLSSLDSKDLETKKLREYIEFFGELPPLNRCS